MSVSVLYDQCHVEYKPDIERCASKISKASGVDVKVTFSPLENIPLELQNNSEYNMVILHGGGGFTEGIIAHANKIREIYTGPIVLESGIYPRGKKELSQHFDGYVHLIMQADVFVNLLKTFDFLQKNFFLDDD